MQQPRHQLLRAAVSEDAKALLVLVVAVQGLLWGLIYPWYGIAMIALITVYMGKVLMDELRKGQMNESNPRYRHVWRRRAPGRPIRQVPVDG